MKPVSGREISKRRMYWKGWFKPSPFTAEMAIYQTNPQKGKTTEKMFSLLRKLSKMLDKAPNYKNQEYFVFTNYNQPENTNEK